MQWKTFAHNGVAFPKEYEPKGLTITILGEAVQLNPLAEEMATAISKKFGTKYLDDQVFTQNFMIDFVKQLPQKFNNITFKDVDFTSIRKTIDSEKEAKLSVGKEEKKQLTASRKKIREDLQNKYGFVLVDGQKFQIANWMVEPPSLLLGRGLLPNRGRWKPRLTEQDVTLNLSDDAPVPPGNWGGIVHETNGFWVARWHDKVSGRMKYVLLHESTPIQIQRNKKKYTKANKLAANIDKIRGSIKKKMESHALKERQLATICYLIDTYGFRIGNEKDKDEAQTIGASTLQVSSVKVSGTSVTFDFLGKDSVRFERTFDAVDPLLIKNLQEFTANKPPTALIFDAVGSNAVNTFLDKLMDGLTAKVFRTFKGTTVVRKFLDSQTTENKELYELQYIGKMANLEAAKALNHKRTMPAKWEEQLQKKEERLKEMQTKSKDKSVKKMMLDIDLQVKTRDYNLNTSLKNYIDPTVYKGWCDKVGLDWAKIYSKTLQKKFAWAAKLKSNSSEGVSDEPSTENGAVQTAS